MTIERKRVKHFIQVVVFVMLCAGPMLEAQTIALDVKDLDISRFPTVQVKVEISRNGNILRAFSRGDFRIFENGVEQVVEDAACPDEDSTRLSIAILIDRSGSMATFPDRRPDKDSTKLRAAKRAVNIFLGFLEDRDEAAVFSFSSNYTQFGFPPERSNFFDVNQDFTRDADLLRRALVPIRALGGTWVWQASVAAINRLAVREGRKVLIVMTDGRSENETAYFPSSVITAAQQEGIPVYTIGLGTDIDADDLLTISEATGGRFYASPDESQLEEVFTRLANEIITDACLLRYTTTAPCLDGVQRRVEVRLSADALTAVDTASYSIPDALQRTTLSLPTGMEIPAKTLFTVPVQLAETLSSTQPLAWSISLRYDPSVLRFMGVRPQGTIAEGAAVTVDTPAPGSIRLSTTSYMPLRVAGSLVDLEFMSFGYTDTAATMLGLYDVDLVQQCPTIPTASGASLALLPCATAYDIRPAALPAIYAGDEVLIPIEITPAVQPGTSYDLTFTLGWDPALLQLDAFIGTGTLAAQSAPVIVQDAASARLTFSGVAVDSARTLVTARFRTQVAKTAAVTPVTISQTAMRTECFTTVAAAGVSIPIDGFCERVVARRASDQFIRNHPNPFNPTTVVTFGLVRAGDVRVSVHDATGREVAVLAEGPFAEGTWRLTFDASRLPAGVYHALLATPEGRTMHPMLLVK